MLFFFLQIYIVLFRKEKKTVPRNCGLKISVRTFLCFSFPDRKRSILILYRAAPELTGNGSFSIRHTSPRGIHDYNAQVHDSSLKYQAFNLSPNRFKALSILYDQDNQMQQRQRHHICHFDSDALVHYSKLYTNSLSVQSIFGSFRLHVHVCNYPWS